MLSEPKKIRVKFSKTGSLKFISHLDLNRTVKSAFIRSKLPIWYTQGFNPHPKTVFSLPLSVGTASLCEFMDFRLCEELVGEAVCERLNAVFPEGLHAIAAYAPQTKFSEIGWADYEIRIETVSSGEEEQRIREVLSGPLPVEKTTKAGTRTVDIAPHVKLLSVGSAPGEIMLAVRLSCEEKTFVNPKYILEFLTEHIGFPSERDDYSVCRTEVYFSDGTTPFL